MSDLNIYGFTSKVEKGQYGNVVEYIHMEKLTIEEQKRLEEIRSQKRFSLIVNDNSVKTKRKCGGCKRAAQKLKELKEKRLADARKGEISPRQDGSPNASAKRFDKDGERP